MYQNPMGFLLYRGFGGKSRKSKTRRIKGRKRGQTISRPAIADQNHRKALKNEKMLANCNNKGEYVAKNPINVIYYNKYGFLEESVKKPL